MIDINIYESQTCKTVSFGRKGENLARRIMFDMSALIAEFGAGSFEWVIRRPHESTVYIAVNKEQDGSTAILNLTATETAISGYGGLELRYYVDDVIVKTIVWRTSIAASLGGGDVPDPIEDYIDQMREIAQEASESADAAGDSATQAAVSAANAAGSATEAAGYAANAAASASASAGSATDSAASATAAHTSETNAANSATAAAGSATNAANSASAASGSASQAASSVTQAAGSASAAANSAIQAAQSATAAAQSATAAASSAQDIAAAATQIQTNKDDITELKNDLTNINGILTKVIEITWIQGAYNRKNGNYGNNNRDACSDGFLPDGIQKLVVPSEYGSRLFAWDATTGQYVGAQMQDGTFATSGTAAFYDTQDIATLNLTYPNYVYKVTVVRDNSTVIDVSTESPLFKAYGANVATKEEVNEIKGAFLDTEKNIEWVSGIGNRGTFYSNANDKTSKPILLYKGETVKIATKGDGQFMFYCIAKVANKNMQIAPNLNGGVSIQTITSNSLTMYQYTATEDEYIIITVYDDATSSVEFDGLNRMDTLDKELNQAMNIINYILKGKTVFFFGDSLTAASTSGLNGFAKIMAENSDTPYESYRMDSADGNVNDVVNPGYPRFANYAKDGTTNKIVSGRTDSVVERVKRHIDADTDVDYVLIECCVNDAPDSSTTKGKISASYTGPFDTSTSIGSIEETIRYLTTLGTPLKIGFFIPWNVVWVNPTFFDAYIPVFEKWGVPCFDMRKCAGFNMRDCEAHRLTYSLTSDNYTAYDDTIVYNLDDLVKYGGNCYKCKADGVIGIPPTDESKWMLVSSESADGTHLNNVGHDVVSGKIQGFVNAI